MSAWSPSARSSSLSRRACQRSGPRNSRDMSATTIHVVMVIASTHYDAAGGEGDSGEIGVQVLRVAEVRQAHGLGRTAFEGGARREPYELGAPAHDAPPRGLFRDRIVGTGDAGAPVVEEIHRDLDEPAALERQAEGLHRGEAARRLADRARDVPRRSEITRIEPHVVGDEDIAGAHDGAAAPGHEDGWPAVG